MNINHSPYSTYIQDIILVYEKRGTTCEWDIPLDFYRWLSLHIAHLVDKDKYIYNKDNIRKDSTMQLLSPEIDWSIWAKKRAMIKMGFEDNHGWSSELAPARVFLGQIRPCIFIVIRVQFS
jgi:hypothetical protein